MGGRAAVVAALAMWAGILLGARMNSAVAWGACALALPAAWLARRAPERVGTTALALAMFAAALARGSAAQRALEAAAPQGSVAAPVWVTVRVTEHPWKEAEEPVALVTVMRDGIRVRSGARLRLRLPAASPAEWGDTLRVLARIESPPGPRVPGGLSARDAAASQGVVAQGRALWVEPAAARPSLAAATVARWRRALERVFARRLSAPAREVVTPLVIGDRSRLGPDLSAQMRAAGLTHLLALSGLHVVWLAAVARGVAAAAGGGARARAWAGAACALFYMGIAGPLPSLARAAATELVAAAACLRGRALDPLQALAVSVTALLALAPGWAGDLGFQLSCAATLGLVTLGRRATTALAAAPRMLAVAAAPLIPTAAAQLTALPILLDRFHAIPWTGLGANLVAIPVCELLLAAAWAGAIADTLWPGAGRWCFGACELLAAALRAIAATATRAPLALLPAGHGAWPVALAAAGAALAAGASLVPAGVARPADEGGVRTRAWLAATAIGLALVLGLTAPTLHPRPGRWWMVVLDVGQGDAIAIGDARGWWLVDAGPRSPGSDAGSSAVLPFLRWAAVRRLETLVLTHDHGDHTGGAPAVRREIPVGRVLVPAGAPRPRAAPPHAIMAAAGDTVGREPLRWVRWPARRAPSRDPNASSLVLQVGEGAARALLAADVDSTVEGALAVDPGLAALKVAHHGAGSSSGAAFLARARPRVAVISCGRSNPFGHPDPGALERLDAFAAEVRRSDRDGTVWLELGPEGAREVEWRTPAGRRALDAAIAPAAARGAGGTLARAPARW